MLRYDCCFDAVIQSLTCGDFILIDDLIDSLLLDLRTVFDDSVNRYQIIFKGCQHGILSVWFENFTGHLLFLGYVYYN